MCTSIFLAFQVKLPHFSLFEIQSLRPFSSVFPLYITTETGFQTIKISSSKKMAMTEPRQYPCPTIISLVQQEKLRVKFLARNRKFELHGIFALTFLSSSESWRDIPAFPNQDWVLRLLSKLLKMFWVDISLLIYKACNKMSLKWYLCR